MIVAARYENSNVDAVASGAVSVEINLEDTPVSHLYQHRLRGTASEMLARMQ